MFHKIKSIMLNLNIDIYWLIEHKINRFEYHYHDTRNEYNIIEYKSELFFVIEHTLYKLEFCNVNSAELQDMIRSYIESGLFYLKNYEIMPIKDGFNFKLTNVVDSVEILKDELYYLEKKEYIGLKVDSTYLFDTITIHYENTVFKKNRIKTLLSIYFEKPITFMTFTEDIPQNGMIDRLIKSNNLLEYKLCGNYDVAQARYVRLNHNMVAMFCKFLFLTLDGMSIIANKSIFSKSDFGKRYFKKNITLKGVSERMIDDEGMIRIQKKFFEDGILKECYNNILSAHVLGLQPGDSEFDYMLNHDVISTDAVRMEVNETFKGFRYQILLEEVLGDNVLFDVCTGNISMMCLGVSNGEKKVAVKIESNIRDIFDNVEYTIGEYKQIQQFIVPEVILKLEGI